jgi:hypothetical protein
MRKPVSITYLRGIVKNCNASLACTSNVHTMQSLTAKRETVFTAIRLFQSAYKAESAELLSQALSFCASQGIETAKRSGKDKSTWDAESFGVLLKSRFGASTLRSFAEKQDAGIDHSDIAVVRNLYGTSAKRIGNKTTNQSPVTSISAKYKDVQTSQVVTDTSGRIKRIKRDVILRGKPETSLSEAESAITLLARADALIRGARKLSEDGNERQAKACQTRAKKLRALARTKALCESEAFKRSAERDASEARCGKLLVSEREAKREASEREARSLPTYAPKHVSELLRAEMRAKL